MHPTLNLNFLTRLALLALNGGILRAAAVTLDFEAVPVSAPGVFANPTAYLASFGITASSVTSGALFGVTISDRDSPHEARFERIQRHESGNLHPQFSDPVSSL